jgi:hypothetical protein
MESQPKDPPRLFAVGADQSIEISDHGDIFLEPDGQVTFVTASGSRHDFAAKDWGFYATPSVNGRLANEGFKTALVQNEAGLLFIMVVELEKQHLFERYCVVENQNVLEWLDERKGPER